MDAAALAGALSYGALTIDSAFMRVVFSLGATTTLLLEAFLLRSENRAWFIVPALGTLLIPFSTARIPHYYSYRIFVFVYTLSAELLFAALLLTAFAYFCIIRPLRARRQRRRHRVAIRVAAAPAPHPTVHAATAVVHPGKPSPDASAAQQPQQPPSSPPSAQPAAAAASVAAATAALRRGAAPGEHPLVRASERGRRRTMTRSHVLAAKLYAESSARESSAVAAAVAARRAERQRAEVQADCDARLDEAQRALDLAKASLRAEAAAATECVRARDVAVRDVRAAGGGADDVFDPDTEALFRDAAQAGAREKAALQRVVAAQAALKDVQTWARRALEE